MQCFPARHHVLPALQASLELMLRRGLLQHVCTCLWNRRTGSFNLDSWFNRRPDEQRRDLSSNDNHFIYFARDGR